MNEMKVYRTNGRFKCQKSEDGTLGYVEALGVRYSNPKETDLYGDYFQADTYFGKRVGNGVDATLNHTMPIITEDEKSNEFLESIANMKFEHAVETEATDLGIVARHVLNLRDSYEAWVFELAEQGAFSWSSGATAHTVEAIQVGDAFKLKRWDIGEWAYTPRPAEPRLPKIQPVKSLENTKLPPSYGAPVRAGNGADDKTKNNQKGINLMDNKELIEQLIEAKVKAAMADFKVELPDLEKIVKTAVESVDFETPDVEGAVKAAFEAWEAKQDATNKQPLNVPNVAKMADLWKYDHMEPGDHALAVTLLNAAAGQKTSQGMVDNASLPMVKSLAIKLMNDEQKDINGRPLHSRTKAAMAKAFQGGLTDSSIHAAKADELNYSTQAGFGDEWIGVAYANELWPRIVQDTPVLNRIPTMEITQGSESVVIPLDGAPPTFYKVAQATSTAANPGAITRTVTTSKQATGNQTLSVETVGAGVDWTGHINEDAVVNFAAELRRNMQQEAAEVMEHIVIDGDTATGATTNINDIGGTPAGTEAFLVANGFRKLALVTNTANSRDGGALAIADFLETIKLLGLRGRNALRKDQVAFILDLATHWKALELSEVASQDVFSRPTIESGVLASIYGYDVLASANMHRANQDATYGLQANSAGKLDLDTAANNTTGAMLAVRFDQWRMGFKRRVTFEVERVPRADAFEITALFRMGLVNRDNEASAISYNLTL